MIIVYVIGSRWLMQCGGLLCPVILCQCQAINGNFIRTCVCKFTCSFPGYGTFYH